MAKVRLPLKKRKAFWRIPVGMTWGGLPGNDFAYPAHIHPAPVTWQSCLFDIAHRILLDNHELIILNGTNPVIRRWMAKAIGPVRAFFLYEFLPIYPAVNLIIFCYEYVAYHLPKCIF